MRSLERGELAPIRGSRARSLARLQGLENAVRAGAGLVAVPYGVKSVEVSDVFAGAMLEGGTRYGESLKVQRGSDNVRFDRTVGGAGFRCPETVLCVDSPASLTAQLYGEFDTDADMLLGASASFDTAKLAFELHSSGPQARLTVPFARWLGVEDWVPLAAQVEIGTEGLYLGPVVTRSRSD